MFHVSTMDKVQIRTHPKNMSWLVVETRRGASLRAKVIFRMSSIYKVIYERDNTGKNNLAVLLMRTGP